LYANIDGFKYEEANLVKRPEIDQWIISGWTPWSKVDGFYAITNLQKQLVQFWIQENLSNWYVRLCREDFWKGEYARQNRCLLYIRVC
jgi:isoleucyl-tRNA synthetase